MNSLIRVTALVASCLFTAWALPGCSSNEGASDRMQVGAMEKGQMEGAMGKDKMDGGAMDKGKMEGAMEKGKMEGAMDKGKMDGGAMEKGKMDAIPK
jgi:hypothetical protein